MNLISVYICCLFSGQAEQLKKSLKASEVKVDDSAKTVLQLRKIGRKYRMQAEETQKNLDELRAKNQQSTTQAELKAIQEKLTVSETELKAVKEKLTSSETEMKAAKEKLAASEQKMKAVEDNLALITENLGSAEYEKNESGKQVKELEAKLKTLTENTNKQQEVRLL